jgi:hypothetical protein
MSYTSSEDNLSSPLYSPLEDSFFLSDIKLESQAFDDFLSDRNIIFETPPRQDGPTLELSHKPRGSKGLWVRVDFGEKIRVAKSKGKKLKLDIDLNPLEVEFDKSNIKVFLKDSQGQTISQGDESNAFTLESLMWNGNRVEMEVKLFRMSRNMRFCVQIYTKNGSEVLTASSVEFSTHNSGNSAKGKIGNLMIVDADVIPEQLQPMIAQLMPAEKKRKLDDIPEYLINDHQDNSGSTNEPVTTLPGSLEVNGRVRARLFTQFSDARLKVNITDIVDALEIVTKLQGKTYEWKRDHSINEGTEDRPRKVIGLIAQEVAAVLPEVVHMDETTGLLSVSYTDLIPILIEAFKQFLREYDRDKEALKFQLHDLGCKLEILSSRIDVADQNYMHNLTKALHDLRATAIDQVQQSQQYAKNLIDHQVAYVYSLVDSIVEGVYARIEYVQDIGYRYQNFVKYEIPNTVNGYVRQIEPLLPKKVSGYVQYGRRQLGWVIPRTSVVITKRSTGG